MSHTPVPPIEGYASYLAAICILNGAETPNQPAPTFVTGGTPSPGEGLASLRLLKSLDDLDEETDEDDDAVDADEEDEDDDEDEDEEDVDEEFDEDDDEDDEDEDEDEDEEEEDGGVKPLKMTQSSATARLQ